MPFRTGPRNLITDVAGLSVGNASDDGLKSGVTVVICEEPAVAGVQVLGGAPGTRETDLLEPHNSVQAVDALVLSGGSAFGLDAASGVQAALREKGVGFDVRGFKIPIVPACKTLTTAATRTGDVIRLIASLAMKPRRPPCTTSPSVPPAPEQARAPPASKAV